MAADTDGIVAVERASDVLNGHSPDRGSLHSDFSFKNNARTRSNSGIELDKLRLSIDSNFENGEVRSPVQARARPSSATEHGLQKPPIGSGKHRRALSSMSLTKLDGPTDTINWASPGTPSPSPGPANGRTRSGSFSHVEISPMPSESLGFSTGRRSVERQRLSRTPTWEEKGKEVDYQDNRRKRFAESRASSRASSPRSQRSTRHLRASGGLSPHRRSLSVSSRSASQRDLLVQQVVPSQSVISEVSAALTAAATDRKIWALRKIHLDEQLCKIFADGQHGSVIESVMKCVEPAKSWLPQIGCTDLQYHALVACKDLAQYQLARTSIAGPKYESLKAIIQLLRAGSPEAQSHAAHAIAFLAEESPISFGVGQAQGCAALVGILPTKAGLGNTYVSFQMAVDHEAAVANAALALANLANALGNQQKMVEAGAIPSLILCLSPGLAAIQASAATCLRKLAKDEEYNQLIVKAGALPALLQLLESDETDAISRAAATEAVGSVITSERMAADTIPHLVSLMKNPSMRVTLAATRALADLASKSRFNRDKISEEADCVPNLLEMLARAESTHAIVALMLEKCQYGSPDTLVERLRRGIGEQRLRALHHLLSEMDMKLTHKMSLEALVQAVRNNTWEHQKAAVRLLQSLAARGYHQARVLNFQTEVVDLVSHLTSDHPSGIMSKALACLASLAAINPRLVWKGVTTTRLAECLGSAKTQQSALRLVVNLVTDEWVMLKVFDGGIATLVVAALSSDNMEIKTLAVTCLSNMTSIPECRQLILGSDGLRRLCGILTGKASKPLGAAAQTLWQLIEDSDTRPTQPSGSERNKVVESILTLSGHRGAVLNLQSEDRDVVEQASTLVASLAKHDDHSAELLQMEGVTGHMLYLLGDPEDDIVGNALETLTCVAKVSERSRNIVVGPDGGSAVRVIELLHSPNRHVRQKAATCLACLSDSPPLAELLDREHLISNLLICLQDAESNEERKVIIMTLAKHAQYSAQFESEYERLGGRDIVYDAESLSSLHRDGASRRIQSPSSSRIDRRDPQEMSSHSDDTSLPTSTLHHEASL